MIILVGSQKGGVGKSTLATNIASLIATQGHDVVLLDADKQSTASTWSQDREANELKPLITCLQKTGDLEETLLDLDKRYKYVIVDCAGHQSMELITAMTVTDVLLAPFKPSRPDLDTTRTLAPLIEKARVLNTKLRAFAVLTMCPTNTQAETDDAREFLQSIDALTVIEPCVYDRKIYRDAMNEGRGVVEKKDNKAKSEIEAVWGAIQ